MCRETEPSTDQPTLTVKIRGKHLDQLQPQRKCADVVGDANRQPHQVISDKPHTDQVCAGRRELASRHRLSFALAVDWEASHDVVVLVRSLGESGSRDGVVKDVDVSVSRSVNMMVDVFGYVADLLGAVDIVLLHTKKAVLPLPFAVLVGANQFPRAGGICALIHCAIDTVPIAVAGGVGARSFPLANTVCEDLDGKLVSRRQFGRELEVRAPRVDEAVVWGGTGSVEISAFKDLLAEGPRRDDSSGPSRRLDACCVAIVPACELGWKCVLGPSITVRVSGVGNGPFFDPVDDLVLRGVQIVDAVNGRVGRDRSSGKEDRNEQNNFHDGMGNRLKAGWLKCRSY
jgi:hypothetical protein